MTAGSRHGEGELFGACSRETWASPAWREPGGACGLALPREETFSDGSYLTSIYAVKDRNAKRDGQRARVIEYRLDDPALAEEDQHYCHRWAILTLCDLRRVLKVRYA